jgi:hypothetical protein
LTWTLFCSAWNAQFASGDKRDGGDVKPLMKDQLTRGEPHEQGRRAQLFGSRGFLLALLICGAVLRLWQYFGNASLWLDELALARNIVDRPLAVLLLQPLAYSQIAPPGFLFIEKGMVTLFGNQEYALRLFPLLCALFSLFLFKQMAEHVLQGLAIPFAVALFALAIPFIRYGAEVKQYSDDVVVALLMTMLTLTWLTNRRTISAFTLGIVGFVAVWFSQTAVFVLVGLSLGGAAGCLLRRDGMHLRESTPFVILWGVGAILAVAVSFMKMTPEGQAYVQHRWAQGFMPIPPHTLADALWSGRMLYSLFSSDFLHLFPGLSLLLMAIGFWSLCRRHRQTALLLLSPIAVTLLGAAVHQYPFVGRLVLFLVPTLLLAIAEGTQYICLTWLQQPRAVGVNFMALVLLQSVGGLFFHLPVYRMEEAKPVLAYVRSHWQTDDIMYVYYGAWQAMQYYGPRYGFEDSSVVIGGCHRWDQHAYLRELDRFRGQSRVWIFLSHAHSRFGEREAILGYLDRIGVKHDSIETARVPEVDRDQPAGAYLYDLSDKTHLAAITAERYPVPLLPVPPDALWGCQEGPVVPQTEDHIEGPRTHS